MACQFLRPFEHKRLQRKLGRLWNSLACHWEKFMFMMEMYHLKSGASDVKPDV